MRCGSRRWCSARPACPSVVPQSDAQPPALGIAALGGDPKPFLFSFPGLLRNIPVLDNAAAGRGLFSIRTERDGIVRRVPMVMQAQGNIMPSLTFEMLRVVTGAEHHSDQIGCGRHQERRGSGT